MRAALYPRVSTDEQAKFGLSIRDQQDNLEKYAKDHKMTIVGVYADEGFSARKKIEQRPAMMRLLEDVKAGKIDIILVTKLDRWFRNIGEYYKVQEILEAHNVSWRTIYEDYDTSTASGRLKINIMLAVAQDEADRTSERIKKVFEGKRARGEACTGRIPTGYKLEDGKVIIDTEVEPYVRRFFQNYMEWGSVYRATASVPELKLKVWLASKMIRGTTYRGDWCGIKIPPYLTAEEYARIQALREKTPRYSKTNRVYLFTGLIRCGECGRRFGAQYNNVSGVYTYRCPGHSGLADCPNQVSIREIIIEAYLLDNIEGKIGVLACAKNDSQDARDLKKEKDAIKRKLSKLSDLYLDDMISRGDYDKRYTALTQELDMIAAEERPAASKTPDELKESFFTGWQNIYKDLTRENKQSFWRMKIKEIRVYKDRRIDFDFL